MTVYVRNGKDWLRLGLKRVVTCPTSPGASAWPCSASFTAPAPTLPEVEQNFLKLLLLFNYNRLEPKERDLEPWPYGCPPDS